MCPPRLKLSFLLRNHIKVFWFQTRPLCCFACRWVRCSFLPRNVIKIFRPSRPGLFTESLVDQGCAVFSFFGFTSRSLGCARWVGRSFLLQNRIKVFKFHPRRLCWGWVVDRWAVFSFFGIILRSLGSTAGVFADSVVAGWAQGWNRAPGLSLAAGKYET